MPPEPLPWNRKDFFKERKNERSESLGSIGGRRWRDSSHHGSRESHRRGSTDYRRPPGHGKQGGSHMFPEESGRGYSISRSGDKILEDDSCRSSISRGEGKYSRSTRDRRGYFSQRDYRGYTSELCNASPNASRRPSDVYNDPREVDNALAYPPNSHPEFMHTWDQRDKLGDVNRLGTGQRYARENTLGSTAWKPFKWTHSGSRGSGFCHSSSSRSDGGVDSGEGKTDIQLRSRTPVDSLSDYAAACVTSSAASEKMTSRKKPRLGWGEGLAKFEKKKVDGLDVNINKDVGICLNGVSESSPCVGAALVNKSLKMTGFSDCPSPATPSSVSCSSSPGLEDKLFEKIGNVVLDVSNSFSLPVHVPQHLLESFFFNLENLGPEPLVTLGSSVSELLQEDPGSVDSTSHRTSAMNKLLMWKVDLSKVLETTESEIDLLESELKSLRSGLRDSCRHPPASSSFTDGCNAKSFDECTGDSNMTSHLKRLQIASTAVANMENPPIVHVNAQNSNENSKEEDVGSPETDTNFFERMPLVQVVKDGVCSSEIDAIQSSCLEVKFLATCSNKREVNISSCGDGAMSGVRGKVEISAGPDPCDNFNGTCDIILAANQKLASSASETFDLLMPIHCCKMHKLGPISDNPLMKVKFASRNRLLRFKERVIAIKFKAFRRLWREDTRLLSIKKSSLKSYRKLEVSLQKVGCGYQKPRSSLRSRFSYPRNLSLVPNSEMISYTKKLLSTSMHKPVEKTLKMPGMILDDKEKVVSKFISSNRLVEDPLALEKERAMINPWTSDEIETFLDKLVIYGKDFCKIASFLDHKTTADCVEFYYKNHKSESFSKIMNQKGKSFSLAAKSVVSGSKCYRENNAASPDILSANSVMTGEANGIIVQQQMHSRRSLLGGYGSMKTSNCGNGVLERSNGLDVVGDERETVAAGVLAGICGSFPSESINTGVSKSITPTEQHREWFQWPPELDVMQSMDDDTCSDESCGEMDPSDWMDEEKATFLRVLSSYGRDFAMISRRLRTRSRDQCKVFFSKARKCLGLDAICSRPQKQGSSLTDDSNGACIDTEYACTVETGFAVGTNTLGNKMEDMPSSVMIMCNDESYPADSRNLAREGLNSFDVEKKDLEDVNNPLSDLSRIRGFSDAILDGDGGSVKQPSVAQAVKNKTASINSKVGGVRANELQNTCAKSLSDEDIIKASYSISVDLVDKMLVSSEMSVVLLERQERMSRNSPQNRGCIKGGTEASGVCELKCLDQGLCAACNGFSPLGEISCSVPNMGPQNQLQVPLETPGIMPPPRECCRSCMSLVLKDSASVKCEKRECQDQSSSTLDLKRGTVRDSGKSVERPNVGQGYPLQVTVNEEVNDDVSCTSSVTELSLLSRKVEELGGHPKIHSRSLSDSANPCRTRNAKQFGKISTDPSVQKSIVTNNNESENRSHNKNTFNRSATLKICSHQNLDGSFAVPKLHPSNHQSHENTPVKIKGLWEGNRTQFGVSPLPQSAQYPSAFGTYPTAPDPPPDLEQHSVETVGNGDELNLNGVSGLRLREKNCNNGVVDCGIYSRDSQKLPQPFKADLKNGQDTYSEMQRRNAFEAVAGNHQGKGAAETNGVGRPSIVLGLSCPGVSEPVVAIRMHYSNIDQNGSSEGE